MQVRDIVFLLVALLFLFLSTLNVLYPDRSIAKGKWWARLTGFDQMTPGFFFGRTWNRLVAAVAALISLIAIVVVLRR